MSFYGIIEDTRERPGPLQIILAALRDWPSFIVLTYLFVIFVVGLVYSLLQENKDLSLIQEHSEHNDSAKYMFPLTAFAMVRYTFFMSFGAKYTANTLYRAYIMLIHPIFKLKYAIDPTIPKWLHFLVAYT